MFEVVNRSINAKDGTVKLSLAQTAFDINARYSVISLASFTGQNSTQNRIEIVKTLDTEEYARESDKWLDFVGEEIRVRSDDYSFDEIAILKEVDPNDTNFLVLKDNLSFIPGQNYIVEPPVYDDTNEEINASYKLQFAHWVAQVEITNVVDSQNFTVNDASKLQVGSTIYIHSDDYSRDSFGTTIKIAQINSNDIILDKPVGFLPVIGDKLENSKFLDDGDPYNLI